MCSETRRTLVVDQQLVGVRPVQPDALAVHLTSAGVVRHRAQPDAQTGAG